MSKFNTLEAKAPATLGAVVEAVTRLSTLSEARILELVSTGKIQELFPFRPNPPDEIPADTKDESELEEASARPLSRKRRATLIQASLPSGSRRSGKPSTRSVRLNSKRTES